MKNTRGMFFLLGGAIGGLLLAIVGISMGWVVTNGRAHASAVEMSDKAVQVQLAKICVHQFNSDSASTGNLAKMKSLNDWEKEKFVEDRGWAKMPGSELSVSGVARVCAVTLTKAGL